MAEAYLVTKRASKVLYNVHIFRLVSWPLETERYICELAPTLRSNAVGGVLGLVGMLQLWCLYRAPPRPRGRRPRDLIWTTLGGCGRTERRRCWERRRGMQKPLAACQGKTVPGAVLLAAVGRSVPGGPQRPLVGENPGSGRRWAGGPGPWAARVAL